MEIEINAVSYRLAKLDVFSQLKVARKLLPVLAGLLSDVTLLKEAAAEGNLYQALEAVLPKIAQALASLSDEDVNAILHPCLSVVSRRQASRWTPIFSQGELMFDDLDLMMLLRLVAQVVGDSLGNFLPERLASEATA